MAARPVKSVSDSLLERTIHLSKDSKLRDTFINNWGEVRVGLVLEELDRLAGAVAYKHALNDEQEVVSLLNTLTNGEASPSGEGSNGDASSVLMKATNLPIVIVTASVDSIVLYRPLAIHNDLKISGRVVLVGRSSMEILLEVDSMRQDPVTGELVPERAIEAHFTMVARSPGGNQAVTIPDLQPTTEKERQMYKRAQEARLRRKASLETSIFTKSPKPEEHELLHRLFYNIQETVSTTSADTRKLAASNAIAGSNGVSASSPATPHNGTEASSRTLTPSATATDAAPGMGMQAAFQPAASRDLSQGYINMEHTFRSSVFVMQPQKRNIHNKVFGGYLMRLAFEQAWCSAYIFSGTLPSFIACDDISFLLPVPLGTLVTFDNTIIFSRQIEDGRYELVVEVKANVLHPAQHTHETTNTFFFFFRASKCDLHVIPSAYTDAMKWLDGKRRLEAITAVRDNSIAQQL